MIGIAIASATARVVGEQLAPGERVVEGRDDHHRGRAGLLGVDAELDGLGGRERAGAGDDRHAAGGGVDGGLDQLAALGVRRASVNSPVLPPGTRPPTPAAIRRSTIAASASVSSALPSSVNGRDQRGQHAVEVRLRHGETSRMSGVDAFGGREPGPGGGLHVPQLGEVVAGQVQVLVGSERALERAPGGGRGRGARRRCRAPSAGPSRRRSRRASAGRARAGRRGSARRSPRRSRASARRRPGRRRTASGCRRAAARPVRSACAWLVNMSNTRPGVAIA